MANIRVRVSGIDNVIRNFNELGPKFLGRLLGPALRSQARIIRRQAKKKNYGFTDRNGLFRGQPRFQSLRQSIRDRPLVGYYGGRKYRSGRAAVFAGGRGARQAHLVEFGHGGPFPASPHPFIRRALFETLPLQNQAFGNSVRKRWPRLARTVIKQQARRR